MFSLVAVLDIGNSRFMSCFHFYENTQLGCGPVARLSTIPNRLHGINDIMKLPGLYSIRRSKFFRENPLPDGEKYPWWTCTLVVGWDAVCSWRTPRMTPRKLIAHILEDWHLAPGILVPMPCLQLNPKVCKPRCIPGRVIFAAESVYRHPSRTHCWAQAHDVQHTTSDPSSARFFGFLKTICW